MDTCPKYHPTEKHVSCIVTLESPIAGRIVIDIGARAAQHKEVVKQLLAAPALTGSDTVLHTSSEKAR